MKSLASALCAAICAGAGFAQPVPVVLNLEPGYFYGAAAGGIYVHMYDNIEVRRLWPGGEKVRLEFDMTPQILVSHPRVMDNQGRATVKRGPIVYTLEQTDQPEGVAVLETGFRLSGNPARDITQEFRPGLLGGVVVQRHNGTVARQPFSSIPLYARLNERDWGPQNRRC